MLRRAFVLGAIGAGVLSRRPVVARADDEGYLAWSLDQSQRIAKGTRKTGKVGSRFHERLLKTERAVNYKLIATWMTPEVIRATARCLQLTKRYTVEQTRALVEDAGRAGDTVFMIELDPREGSGVIPNDWEAYLQPRGESVSGASVPGTSVPKLRDVAALAGIEQRNYDYDRFWVTFPLTATSGKPVFSHDAAEAELIVRVYSQEEHTFWPVPDSVRR